MKKWQKLNVKCVVTCFVEEIRYATIKFDLIDTSELLAYNQWSPCDLFSKLFSF